MQFYDATNKRAICEGIERECDSDDTSYPRLAKTAEVNDGLEELVGILVSADGVLQFDDTNYTDAPRGLGTLVEGQSYYTYASEYLKIEAVDILGLDGVYRRIKQIDISELSGLSPEEYFGIESGGGIKKGLPEYYDPEGDSFRLYPAPTSTSCTLVNGYRIWFKRTASLFTPVSTTAADTTEPGIPSPYHKLLVYYASIPYCVKYKKDRVAWLEKKWDEGVKALITFKSHQNPDHRSIIQPKIKSFR